MEKRKYYIWGTGKRAQWMYDNVGHIMEWLDIKGYIDNNNALWGSMFNGYKVYSPDILRNEEKCYLVLATTYQEEILKQLQDNALSDKIRVEENFMQKLQIIDRYKNASDAGQREIAKYLENNSLHVFNYAFVSEYADMECEVGFDSEKDLYYAIYQGKKMFLSRQFHTMKKARQYFKWLCMEQDARSPHRYMKEEENLGSDLVILDGGVAEGNFSLSLVEKAKKIYFFEPDENWVEALKYTFEPYREKVVIIQKSLSDYENRMTTTIDREMKGEKIDVLKLDIKGEELYALKGGQQTIQNSPDIKCFVCTYHQEFAYDAVKAFFEEIKFETEVSSGYMWFPENPHSPRGPVLRHGIIRAIHQCENKEED
ncbi:MAG: FkbM family methyltransferase [Ruminococcus flavefaciens]|nr:FkbM family methyltransferase [Roseburia sp.]MCM1231439.1 FkbM family methyltransferase [Ruminococcus flavefaciens]